LFSLFAVQVERENLLKDLNERKELLVQASQALRIVEENKEIENNNAERLVCDLQLKIETLEEEKNALQQALADTNKSHLGNDTGYADFLGAVDSKEIETQRKILELSQLSEKLQQQLSALSEEMQTCKIAKEESEASCAKLKYERDELSDRLIMVESEVKDSVSYFSHSHSYSHTHIPSPHHLLHNHRFSQSLTAKKATGVSRNAQ
jgi:chromosome segregation ATPase